MIGTVIKEQYQIVAVIGEGGMGVVYKALDLELGRHVALKFLKGELAGNSILLQRFRDELRVLAGFNHPNITTLFTSVTWQENPVMVMELLEGETLQKMVERRGPIPADVCVPLVNQALAGVGSAHRKKIIHRDLKPGNLMLTVDGVVKVMDFGIAKIQNGPALTRSNVAIGTSLYMAPEQILGGASDARTDIYAMGVTLYELLAGRVPFIGDSQYAIEHAHIQQIPEPPTIHYPYIPAFVVEAVMKALAKEPAQRFQSAEEFAAALGGAHPQPAETGGARSWNTTSAFTAATAQPAPYPGTTPVPRTGAAPPATPSPIPVPESPANAAQTPRPETTAPVAPNPRPGKSKLVGAVSLLAAALALVAGAVWIISRSNHSLPSTAGNAFVSGASSGAIGGGGSGSKAEPLPAVERIKDEAANSTGGKDEPFLLPTTPVPEKPALVRPDESAHPVTPAPDQTPASTDGIAGQWTGTYDRCEDGSSTQVALKLREPSPGRISGNLRFSTPQGETGGCALSGALLGQGANLSLSVSECSGVMPAYLAEGHKSLLTYSAGEMTGSVEPQNPCMTIALKKNLR